MSAALDFSFLPQDDPADVVELVRLGEQLGFRCAWLPDNSLRLDPFVLLAACAGATSRIDLGIAVTTPFTRHPAQIARAAASLDRLAEGRVRLGLGAGNPVLLLEPLGVSLHDPVRRVADAITIVRGLVAGEEITHRGKYDSVHRARLDFAPYRPSLPVYVGTRAPKMLALAGRYADGVLLNTLCTDEGLHWATGCIAAGAATAGRTPGSLDVVAGQAVAFAGDAMEEVRAFAARSIVAAPEATLRLAGIEPAKARRVRDLCERGGAALAADEIDDATLGRMAVVGAACDVARGLTRALSHGATSLLALCLGGPAAIADTLAGLAREVAPLLTSNEEVP